MRQESFEGQMARLFVPWGPMGRMVKGYFDGFGEDVKRKAEEGRGE